MQGPVNSYVITSMYVIRMYVITSFHCTLTLGEYQIRQAASYTAELEDRAGDHTFQVAQHDQNLLRGRMFSRH